MIADVETAAGLSVADIRRRMFESVRLLDDRLLVTLVRELKAALSHRGSRFECMLEHWRSVYVARRAMMQREGLTTSAAAAKTTTNASSGRPPASPVAGQDGPLETCSGCRLPVPRERCQAGHECREHCRNAGLCVDAADEEQDAADAAAEIDFERRTNVR